MVEFSVPEGLIAQLRQGDQAAFSKLHQLYRPQLLRTIHYLVKDAQQAEDLLQDTFIKAWLHLHRYDPQQGTLINWLLRIARNTTLDYLRRPRYRRVGLDSEQLDQVRLASEQPPPQTIGVKGLTRQTLRAEQWAVIELAYWQGYTQAEIAQELGLPLGTVKSRVHQAMRQLRPLFQ